MLKAVRLDDELHKDIIKFIEEYVDDKGKHNESAAIRHLIINGYKSLNPEFIPLEKEIIDINKLKRELLGEIKTSPFNMNEIKTQLREEILKEMGNFSSMDDIRHQIKEELLREMNLQKDQSMSLILEKLNLLEKYNSQPMYIQQPIYSQPQYQPQPQVQPQYQPQMAVSKHENSNVIKETPIKKNNVEKKKVEVPVDVNPLMANILANANR